MVSRIQAISALVALALAVASCSVPTDEQAVIISPDQLPDVLREDLATTTTLDAGPLTETVEVFLLSTAGDRVTVVPVARDVDLGAAFADQIALLFAEEFRTEEEIANNWFNSLRGFVLNEAFVNDNGVAIVDLVAVDDDGATIEVETQVLVDAVAQLVYTATGSASVEPATSVRILVDGEAIFLPTQEGDTSAVVDRSDFETYDPAYVPPSTTAPPTTSTTISPVDGIDSDNVDGS